jgi:hypothetical protein
VLELLGRVSEVSFESKVGLREPRGHPSLLLRTAANIGCGLKGVIATLRRALVMVLPSTRDGP